MTTRTAFFRKLGAEFANQRWSWCAVHHGKREVYFGVWDTLSAGGSGIILSEAWERVRGRRQAGYSDALKKIDLVNTDNYKLKIFRMIQGQDDHEIGPSVIKAIDENLIPASVIKVKDDWIALFDSADDGVSEVVKVGASLLFFEGEKRTTITNVTERNGLAREACIQAHGAICRACKFDFEKVYGDLGIGFIHVHHINPVANSNGRYLVDPVEDLCPLCPNCHAMVHRINPPMLAEELTIIINRVAAP